MKWTLALLATFAFQSHAALIEYTYDMTTYKLGSGVIDTSPATSILLVDTSSETIERFSYNNNFADFLWVESVGPRIIDDIDGPVAFTVFARYETDAGSFYQFFLEHDELSYADSPLNHLDTVNFDESVFDFQLAGDSHWYGGAINSASKRIISVPEPATLSLLFLGLAAIGIRRRLR